MAVTRDKANTFDKILNFRDVAVFVNQHEDRAILRPGKLYRSARPDMASASDRVKLSQDHGLRTFIDLRSKTEHIEAAKKFTNGSRSSPAALEAAKIPGVRYAEVNLNGKGFERHIAWQLSYVNLARLATNMLLGYRKEGITIISQNVMLPRGLIGLGQDTLQHSGPEVKEVFDILSNPDAYPVMVHCTQGKDRTGLIVILVLLLCDINIATITQDYTLSETELEPEYEDRMKEIRSIGLDESFAKCPENFVRDMARFIDSQYGSVEQYLSGIGVQKRQITQVRGILVL